MADDTELPADYRAALREICDRLSFVVGGLCMYLSAQRSTEGTLTHPFLMADLLDFGSQLAKSEYSQRAATAATASEPEAAEFPVPPLHPSIAIFDAYCVMHRWLSQEANALSSLRGAPASSAAREIPEPLRILLSDTATAITTFDRDYAASICMDRKLPSHTNHEKIINGALRACRYYSVTKDSHIKVRMNWVAHAFSQGLG